MFKWKSDDHLREFGSGYVRFNVKIWEGCQSWKSQMGMRLCYLMWYANILNCDWRLLAGQFHHVFVCLVDEVVPNHLQRFHVRNKSDKSHRSIRSHQGPSTPSWSINHTVGALHKSLAYLLCTSFSLKHLETGQLGRLDQCGIPWDCLHRLAAKNNWGKCWEQYENYI